MKQPSFLRRLVIAVMVMFGVLAVPGVAFAQDAGAPITVEDAGDQFVLSPFLWKTITALILPIVIFLITKASGNPVVKGVVGIVVAAIDALVIRWTTLDGEMLFDQAALQDIFHVYGIQLLTYLGILRQTTLDQKLAPNTGLG